jgi:hypothetical protein
MKNVSNRFVRVCRNVSSLGALAIVVVPFTTFAQSSSDVAVAANSSSVSGTVTPQVSTAVSGASDIKTILTLAILTAVGVLYMAVQANRKQVARVSEQQ